MNGRPRRAADLRNLESEGVFEVRFEGDAEASPLGRTCCVWYEIAYGEAIENPGEGEFPWASLVLAYHTEKDVRIRSPLGPFELSWRRLRVHVAPGCRQVFSQAERQAAPQGVQDWLAENPGPATVAEYCLAVDRTYWARVDREAYCLPPEGPDQAPQDRVNLVLQVSDVPFRDGKPVGPRTPVYHGWSY